MKKSVLAAAAARVLVAPAAAMFLAAPPARAELGILTCQIMVSEFTDDAARARNQLSANQMAAARDFVEVARSQCRSSPDIVNANLQSLRTSLALPSGPQSSSQAFDDFWPADSELAELSR